MLYNRPDFMYVVNCLYSYSAVPYVTAFQDVKHLICYLYDFPNRPIRYTDVT